MRIRNYILSLILLLCTAINAQGQTSFNANQETSWDYGKFELNTYYAFQFKSITSNYTLYYSIGSEPNNSSNHSTTSNLDILGNSLATNTEYDIYVKVFSGNTYNESNLAGYYHWHFETGSNNSIASNCYYEKLSGGGGGSGSSITIPYTDPVTSASVSNWSSTLSGEGVKYKDNDNNYDIPSNASTQLNTFEVWRRTDSVLPNGKITRTITGVPNGTYTVTLDVSAIPQYSDVSDPSGVSFKVNNGTAVSLSALTLYPSNFSNTNYRSGTITFDGVTITNGQLNFEIDINGCNFNWLLFKNLTIDYAKPTTPQLEIYNVSTSSDKPTVWFEVTNYNDINPSNDSNIKIYYTIDGSTPTSSSSQITRTDHRFYHWATDFDNLSSPIVIKAITYDDGETSNVGSLSLLKSEKPSITYNGTTATVTTSNSTHHFYYSKNAGTTWTKSSETNIYSLEITGVDDISEFQVRSHESNKLLSDIASLAQKPEAPILTVTHKIADGDWDHQDIKNYVTFVESTAGATIYYTTDGSNPATSSTAQTIASGSALEIDAADANYSNVVSVRAVAKKYGLASDEATIAKSGVPTMTGSDNNLTVSIKTSLPTYLLYKKKNSQWTLETTSSININYSDSDLPVSAIVASLNCLLGNITNYGIDSTPLATPELEIYSINLAGGSNPKPIVWVEVKNYEDIVKDNSIKIYHTIDGSEPTNGSRSQIQNEDGHWIFYYYATSFDDLSDKVVFKAKAMGSGRASDTGSMNMNKSKKPTIAYDSSTQTATIKADYIAHRLYYSTDGGTTWKKSTTELSSFSVTGVTDITNFQVRGHGTEKGSSIFSPNGDLFSDIATFVPELTVYSNSKHSGQSGLQYVSIQVTNASELKASDSNKNIYYTIDGSDPTTSSKHAAYVSSDGEYFFDLTSGDIGYTTEEITIKAIAVVDGITTDVSSLTIKKADKPTITYDSDTQTATISTTNPAIIFYTTDGWVSQIAEYRDTPLTISGVTDTEKVRAWCYEPGKNQFFSAYAEIFVMPDAPTIEIVNSFDWDDWEGEDITTEITIDNTSYKDGDIIYYTTDGSDPTTSSTVKTGVNTYKLLYYDVMNAGYNYNSVDAIRAVVNRGDVTTTETRVDKIDDPTFTESGNSLTISNSNADWIVYKQNNTDWTRIEGNSVTINNPDYPVSAIAVKNGYLMSNIAMYVGGDKYDDWIPSWTTGEPNYNNLNKDNDLPEKSVVKSPSLELWAGNPSSFDGKHISHKAISVPNGIYRITLDFTAMNQSNVPDNIGGCGFYERNIDNNTNVNIGVSNVGTQFTYSSKPQWSANTLNGYARTGTVDMIVEITDGEINFEIDFAGCKFNWFVFKNFNYEYLGSQDNMFVHYEGVASQMGIPPAGLKTDYKTSADDPRIASGVTIQRAHEYTHDIYVMPGEKVNLQPFSDFSNKYEYRNAYQRWYDYTTDSKSSRLTFYQEPNSLKSENYYCSNLFNFNNTNNNSIPNGFHLRGNGTDANGGTNVSNSVSSKQKFADGGTLVHVISLHANSSSDKVSMTFGENGQLHLKPGKFRISFDCVGVGGGYPTVEFSIAPRNNTSATIFKGNVSPYPYTVNSFSNTVEDSKYFNTTITIENEADYVLIWQMDGMDTGTQTFAFDNIQVAGIGEMTNTNLDSNVREFYGADGVSKGHFGGTALNTGRTVATIATYTAPTSTDDIFDIIAIDIANDNSSTKYNTDLVLEEPTLSYRHIFVIHNAQVQAEEISGSKSNNDNYIRTHRIKISCPEGTPLQYRLDNYEYRGWGANAKPSGYYIKTGTDTYAPVYHYRVEFLEGENQGYNNIQYNEIVGCTVGNLSYDQNGEIIGHNLNKQFAEHPILSQEETVCNNMQRDLVYTYKCTDGFDRMLYWKEPVVGNYRIRIYAVSAPNAESYSDIDIWDYDGQNIVLMEYDLEVLPASKASMVDENTLKNNSTYSHQSSQALQEAYGDPTVKVDFDEITLDQCNLGNNNHGYYKWPLTWEMSSYAFCYDNANNTDVADYNTYMVANKASQTAYHSSSANDVYDRRYADTNGSQLGFFFYANAASDPGRMAVLNIGNNLCQGTRIFVSAWVNELNNWPETANVCFAFKGVMADGTEDLLGSYVSGYVTGGCNDVDGFHSSAVEGGHSHGTDNRTKWMHIYFCVTPSSNYGNKNYDHYIIALENNSASSFGADYAIDDIQTFVCHPELQAFQEKPVCNGDPATKLILRTDYDLLLQAFPTQYIEQSEHSDVSMAPLYFTFIDKDKYESLLEPDGSNYDEAFDASIVRGAYPNPSNMKGPANPERTYGKMWFDLYYNGNPSHQTSGAEILNTTTTRELIGERRLLYFPSVNCINDVNIKIGTNYWCVMSAYDPGLDETPLSQTFDLRDVCTSKREFEVIFSGEIKVDGKLTAKDATQNICANQRPKIEINLNGISKGGDVVKTENAYFDWYFGPMNDPDPSTIGADDEDRYYYNEKYAGQDLYTALAAFRDNYPEDDDVASCEVKGTFIQAMKDCIEHFVEEGILSLYKTTEFASTYDKFNEPLSSNEQKEIELTAIPINPTPDDETILYCLEAFQINIPISTRTPILKNGDDKGIVPYPSHMRDVPLRIGLKELQRCCTLSSLNDDSGYKFLYMPLRDPTPVTEGVDKMAITKSKDDAVYLVASNDPNVAAGTSGARRVTTYADGTAMDEDEKIYYIGKVSDIVAKTWDKTQSSSNPGNVCHLAFFNNFKFREGYWYTIKFNFEEDYDTTTDDNYDVCPGDVICTIKVVPEYQMWTGKVDGNWNNDANWRRVTKEELMNPTSISADYITDGTGDYANDNTSSFVPADFTKVVIPANSKHMPELYDLRSSGNLEDVDYIGGSGTTNFIRYMTADEEAREGETNNNVQDYRAYIGAASDTINFDMASVVLNDGNVACRSWYDHTCDEIHFMSGAQLINQQYLHYNKAWADIEINPGRWYTMSLPITNVVSGDFYLPTAGARQETPLFEDITYSTELNDRFKPAVYQRTWNASDAKVYKLNAGVENAAEGISLNWSHVYNDALVNYSAGNGYSIKADVSALAETDRPEKVLFRFPKADTSYTYYNPGNTDGDAKTDNVPSTYLDGSSKRTYRLADITSGSYWQSVGENTKNDSKYFLVGNPLMCSLDMEKFFDNNTSLARKYWIVTAEGQRAFVMDEETNGFIGTGTDGKLTQPTVEPFQSFFVALADGSTPGSLRTEIKPEMMVLPENPSDNDPTNNDPTNPSGGDNTRAESNPSGIIHISATDERGLESNMVITDGAIRHTMGAETLFDSNLADEPMLYSVIDGQAMTIGEMKSGQTIPVGITGISGEATITLSGIESFKSSLYLIDALTGETEPLTSDITLKQTGNGVRYYLTSKQAIEEEKIISAPVVLTNRCHLTIKTPADTNIEKIQIFTTGGICVVDEANLGMQYDTDLAADIYIIRLISAEQEYKYKIVMH